MFSKNQWMWIFIALAMLRLVIGYHFFTEGKKKIDAGRWDASGFFKSSVGPGRPFFLKLLPDYDGTQTLCLHEKTEGTPVPSDDLPSLVRPIEGSKYYMDTRPTLSAWGQYQKKILTHYKLSQSQQKAKVKELKRLISVMKAGMKEVEKTGDRQMLDISRLAIRRAEAALGRVKQSDPYNETFSIIGRRAKQLQDYLTENKEAIENFAVGKSRLIGFTVDGKKRKEVGQGVDSLRGQISTIRSDREKVKTEHVSAIEGIWSGLASELNEYGKSQQIPANLDQFGEDTQPKLYCPSTVNPDAPIYWINRIVPYFDLVLGILLLVGFFSRIAGLLGMAFLFGILATQPPWVGGASNTFPQWIEFFGLFVIAATGAGRFGGLDGVFAWMFGSKRPVAENPPAESA